jgi:hypothetical protein
MESLFSLLQKNVLNRRRWQSRDELRVAIVLWIEKTYHRRPRRQALGRLTPIEFETLIKPLMQPERPYPTESIEVGAVPYGGTGHCGRLCRSAAALAPASKEVASSACGSQVGSQVAALA